MSDTPLTYEQARSNAEKIADAELKACVVRGMEVLLEHLGPEWPDLIDPSELLMGSPTQCVLGQLYDNVSEMTDEQREKALEFGLAGPDTPSVALAGYYKGLAIIDGDVEEKPWMYGFDRVGWAESEWGALDEAWQIVLGGDEE